MIPCRNCGISIGEEYYETRVKDGLCASHKSSCATVLKERGFLLDSVTGVLDVFRVEFIDGTIMGSIPEEVFIYALDGCSNWRDLKRSLMRFKQIKKLVACKKRRY